MTGEDLIHGQRDLGGECCGGLEVGVGFVASEELREVAVDDAGALDDLRRG